MELAGELLAVTAWTRKFGEADGNVDAAFAQEVDQVGKEGHVFPVTNFLTGVAVVEVVFNESSGDGVRRVRSGYGLEESGLERQDGLAIRAGALGKQHDERPSLKHGLESGGQGADLGTFFAVGEQGAPGAGEPTEHRPVFDFALGDKDGGSQGAQHKDIEVAEMVGDQEAGFGDRTSDGKVGAKDAKEALRGEAEPTASAGQGRWAESAKASEAEGGEEQFGDEPDQPARQVPEARRRQGGWSRVAGRERLLG